MNETKPLKTTANQSSDKLLYILETLVAQAEPLRLQEIAKLCDMNASTALRFLSALQKRGYVAQDMDTGRYYVTYKICALAESVSASSSVRTIALPFMRSMANLFNESCNLAIEQDMTIMYVEVIRAPNNLLMSTQRIGNVAPMHCTGIGKLFLACYSEAEMDKYLAIKKMIPFTANTIISAEMLKKEVEQVARLGYAFDNEECEVGVRCIAVPILDYTGKMHAGLSVSGPAVRMTDEFIYTRLSALQETAHQLSMCMGWQNGGA